MGRCRICKANDREALVNDVARAMWETQSSTNPDDEWRPWDRAGPYWQRIMREFANATVKVLKADHLPH